MRHIKTISLLLLLIFFFPTLSFAQGNQFLKDTGFPVPSYVKRGLVIYYDSSGEVTSQGKTDYVTFQKIIIVQKVEGQKVIGTIYSINPTSQMISTETKILGQGGSGIFYIHPDLAKKMQGKEELGFRFETPGIIKYTREGEEGAIEYDPKSGLFLGMKAANATTKSVEVYKGYEYINLPPLPNEFPPSAKEYHSYTVYTILQGLNTPFSTISISPISFGKQIALFKLTTNTNTGINSTKEIYGTTLMGPHYINPQVLKDGYTILKLKNRNLTFYVQGEDQYGKITHFVVDGMEYYTTHIDPQTGLVMYQDQMIYGTNSIIRLVLSQ